MPNKCDNVISLKQTDPHYWTNSILMAILYSEESRKLLLEKSNTWDVEKDKTLYENFKYVLKNKKMRDNDYTYLEDINNNLYKKLIFSDKKKIILNINNQNAVILPSMYIRYIYNTLDVNVLYLDKNGDKLYYSLYNDIHISLNDEIIIQNKNLDGIEQILNDHDVIIINTAHITTDKLYPKHYDLSDNRFKKYDSFFKNIIKLNEDIAFNDKIYVQDSVILNNLDEKYGLSGVLSIAGIKCDGEKYVYNGILRSKNDEGDDSSIFKKNKEIKCELIKYEWDLISENNGAADIISKNNSCENIVYSFSKGNRYIIYVKKEQIGGKVGYSLINTIFESVISNNILLIITLLLITFVLLSVYPILYLKYYKDLYENINIFNDICYDNTIKYNSNISIKNTFIWKISNILFDFNKIDKKFKKKRGSDNNFISFSVNNKNTDFHRINKSSSNDDLLIIYDKYVKYSIPIILFMILLFLIHLIHCFYNYYYNEKLSINDIILVIYIFIYLVIIIIFFSIILKNIMDLYHNTDVYNYIMLLKELDIILKEGKKEKNNDIIIKILKKYSNDENINIEEVNLNKSLINDLIDFKYENLIQQKNDNRDNVEIIDNNDKINITLENIDNMKKYISKESNQKIFKQINKIANFLFVYIFLLLPLLYILSILLKKIYIFCLFFIIGMLIFSISIYNMHFVIGL